MIIFRVLFVCLYGVCVYGQAPVGTSTGGTGPIVTGHAPTSIHHVGVSYNILKGNPDGEYWSTGGEDPGTSLTRKVLTVSPGDMPPELIVEHHDGCQYSNGFTLFYDPYTYQQKLFQYVQTTGTVDDVLKPYAFTLSSGYQAVVQQTSQHHYVYQDSISHCTLGHARYSMNLADTDRYPVSREFAHDVCALPATYDQAAYMDFVERWGTHIVTEVTVGKSSTYRYSARINDLFNYIMFNVTDELSMGGPLDGYPSSFVVDMDSYKYRHEYKYILGPLDDQLNIGDVYNSDVIAKSLEPLDAALDPKYWQFISYYASQGLCAPNASNSLATWKTNIIQALKAYPSFKRATPTTKTPLQMPATWPLGTYSMPKPSTGCQTGYMEGSVMMYMAPHTNDPSTLHLDGTYSGNSYELKYCTKEDPYPSKYDIYWPRGDYCIQTYDDMCPYAFGRGSVTFNNEKPSSTSGVVPTGTYGTVHTELQFCCRNDSVYTYPIFLPAGEPFYLYRNQHHCQQVSGMTVTEETVTFYNNINSGLDTEQTQLAGSYPHVEVSGQTIHGAQTYKLFYCYYAPITE